MGKIKYCVLNIALAVIFGCGGGGGGGGGAAAGGNGGGGGEGPVLALSLLAGPLGGPGNRDGIGAAARFYDPRGIVTVGGNAYVADSYNHTIRRIDLATGQVTTFAGSAGKIGYTNGVGAAARFFYPRGIASDGSNLFVADELGPTIRRIVLATGEVTTLAGTAGQVGSTDGTGAAARFFYPHGLALTGTNLFVTDSYHHTVRRVDTLTAMVTTLAGTAGQSGAVDGTGPAARFNSPHGVATDGTSVFVTDTNNQTIRMIDINSAAVTTLAGTAGQSGYDDGTGAAARFYYPHGLACDGTSVFVAGGSSPTIRRIVVQTRVVSTIAGSAGQNGSADGAGAAARFYVPRGVAMEGTNLLVADSGNHLIRRMVLSNAGVTTLAGTATFTGSTDATGALARFSDPHGVATDGTNVLVADSSNHTIRKIVIATGAVTTLAGKAGMTGSAEGIGAAARFYYPEAVAMDGTNAFVTDLGNHTIRKIVLATGQVTTLAGTAEQSGSADGTGAAARFYYPKGIATDGTDLFVADSWNHTIRRIVLATGEVTTIAGSAGQSGSADGTGSAARFRYPEGLAVAGTNLYVADTYNYTIRQIAIGTGEVTTLAGTADERGDTDGTGTAARFSYPQALATDGARLYVAESQNYGIRGITLGDGQVSTIIGVAGQAGVRTGTLPALLNRSHGVAYIAGGKLVIAVSTEQSVLVADVP